MKFFCLLAILALVWGSNAFQARPEQAVAQRVTFADVPAAQSKITWVHDNGRSEIGRASCRDRVL